MLPAAPPAAAPLAATVPPPDTSSTEPEPSTTPPWPCTVTTPPAVVTAMALPSRRWLAKLPDRSMRVPAATSTRPRASRLTLPPALRTSLFRRSPPALVSNPAARVSTARSGSSSVAPASVPSVAFVASVMRPKPPSCNVDDATCDAAGKGAPRGSTHSAGSAAAAVARSVSAVSTPVPRKAAVPKLPPLLTLPTLKRALAAAASRPSRWRVPICTVPASAPFSWASGAVTSTAPAARPST